MEGMNARLLSRFKWGLSADLQVPDLETRIAIIEKKLYKDGVNMPKDVVEYLAYSITTNIRELEGALISILAQSSLNKKAITLDLAKKIYLLLGNSYLFQSIDLNTLEFVLILDLSAQVIYQSKQKLD